MMKPFRVYPDPDNSVRFNRFATAEKAIVDAYWSVGIFGGTPKKVVAFVGEIFSLHIYGDWGRVVLTGPKESLSEVKILMR